MMGVGKEIIVNRHVLGSPLRSRRTTLARRLVSLLVVLLAASACQDSNPGVLGADLSAPQPLAAGEQDPPATENDAPAPMSAVTVAGGPSEPQDETTPTDPSPPSTGSGTITEVESARTVTLPAGRVAVGEKRSIDLPPSDEYWLDYRVTFNPGYEFTPAGKLPGLAGGSGTSGCDGRDPRGWSARLGWASEGRGNLYVYDQHRENRCGNNNYFGQLRFEVGREHRLTQWVKLNSPGQRDGAIHVWLDGERAVGISSVELRGDVGQDDARIDTLQYSVFSGGDGPRYAPPRDISISFGAMYVMTCPPDFSSATPQCAD